MTSIYRTSKHILKYQTKYKTEMLNWIFEDYKIMLEYYIDLILSGELPLNKNLSTKYLPNYKFDNSRWKSIVYRHASQLIRININVAKKRRYNRYKKVYHQCKKNNKCKWFTDKKFTELYLKPIHLTKFVTKPKINKVSINLNEHVCNYKRGYHFDEFIQIRTPYFHDHKSKSIKINIPIKHHRHSNNYKNWKRRKTIQLMKKNNKYFINLYHQKEQQEINKYSNNIGIDQGYKKLLTCSNGKILGKDLENLYNEISNKKQGSKEFKRKLIQRDNLINYYCNKLDLNDVGEIVIEDLKNVKHGSKQNKKKIHKNFMNKLQRWSYRKTTDKLERLCEENGILLTKVNPSYTSQTCSYCGYIDKDSRNGENFSCQYCGSNLDADLNAAINLSHMGVCSPHNLI